MCLRVQNHLEKKLQRVSRHRTQGAFARACTKTGRLSGNSKGGIALSMSFFIPVFQRLLFHNVFGGYIPDSSSISFPKSMEIHSLVFDCFYSEVVRRLSQRGLVVEA
jgi:hypothetical protein